MGWREKKKRRRKGKERKKKKVIIKERKHKSRVIIKPSKATKPNKQSKNRHMSSVTSMLTLPTRKCKHGEHHNISCVWGNTHQPHHPAKYTRICMQHRQRTHRSAPVPESARSSHWSMVFGTGARALIARHQYSWIHPWWLAFFDTPTWSQRRRRGGRRIKCFPRPIDELTAKREKGSRKHGPRETKCASLAVDEGTQ